MAKDLLRGKPDGHFVLPTEKIVNADVNPQLDDDGFMDVPLQRHNEDGDNAVHGEITPKKVAKDIIVNPEIKNKQGFIIAQLDSVTDNAVHAPPSRGMVNVEVVSDYEEVVMDELKWSSDED